MDEKFRSVKNISFNNRTKKWEEYPVINSMSNIIGLYRYHFMGFDLKQNMKIIRVNGEAVDSAIRWVVES